VNIPTQAKTGLEWATRGSYTLGAGKQSATVAANFVSSSFQLAGGPHNAVFVVWGFLCFPVLTHQLDSFSKCTEIKTGLEWATPEGNPGTDGTLPQYPVSLSNQHSPPPTASLVRCF